MSFECGDKLIDAEQIQPQPVSVRSRRTWHLALFLTLIVASCGDDDDASERQATYEQQCEELGRTSCLRSLQCNLTFTDEDLCTAAFLRECCGDDDRCDDDVSQEMRAAFSTCNADVAAAECEVIEAGGPDSCMTLPVSLP